LLAAAEGARQDVLDADFLALYRTVELEPPAPEGDVALLTSGSAARALAATGARMPVVAIGPQTAAEARACGFDVVAVAESHDLDGLVEVVQSL
jgi:uroporphyrinogen-III synthase